MFYSHRTILFVLLFSLLLSNPVISFAFGENYDEIGFRVNKNYIQYSPFEFINPFNGNVILSHTDIELPGNGGLDLKIQRTYNSKVFSELTDTSFTIPGLIFGDLGIGWDIHFGRISVTTDPPFLQMPDGSIHILYPNDNSNINSNVTSDFITEDLWLVDYDSGNDLYILKFQDGTVYTFGQHLSNFVSYDHYYVTSIKDSNNNEITIDYYDCCNQTNPNDGNIGTCPDPGNLFSKTRHINQIVDSVGRVIDFSMLNNECRGNAISSIDANGDIYQYNYYPGSDGPVTPVVGYDGGSTRLLSEVVPPEGPSWQYFYDFDPNDNEPDGELISVRLPTGALIEYDFDTFDLLLQPNPPSNFKLRALSSRTVSGPDVPGGTWNFDYDPTNTIDITTITDPCGNKEIYSFWGLRENSTLGIWSIGLLTSKETRDSADNLFQLETNGWNPYMISDFGFDILLGTLGTSTPRLMSKTINRDGVDYTTDFTYSRFYNSPTQIVENNSSSSELSRTTNISYFENIVGGKYIVGKPGTTTITVGSESKVITSSYDMPTGNLTSENRYGVITEFSYFPDGNLNWQKDARGFYTHFENYFFGVPELTKFGSSILSGTDPVYTESRTVNWEGTIADFTNGRGFLTQYQYDGLNRLTRIIPPPSGEADTEISYDNVSGRAFNVVKGISEVQYLLDGLGRSTGTFSNVGVQTEVSYDACGRRIYESLPFDTSTTNTGNTFSYDALDRLVNISRPDNSDIGYTYQGNSIVINNERSINTRYNFKSFGDPDDKRLFSVEDGNNKSTDYEYDLLGNITKVTTPLSSPRDFIYNSKNFLQSEVLPESGTTTYNHDEVGNVTTKTDANNNVINYTYDRLGRLTFIDHGSAEDDITLVYDNANNRTTMSSSSGSYQYTNTYDQSNRLTNQNVSLNSGIINYNLGYSYDDRNNLTQVTYPSGEVVNYAHDAANRVTDAFDALNNLFVGNMQYHPSGSTKSTISGFGVETELLFDQQHRLDSLKVKRSFPELKIIKQGLGDGLITSVNFGGINCGDDCRQVYGAPNITIDLVAQEDIDSNFVSWTGDPGCESLDIDNPENTSVLLDTNKTCIATFALEANQETLTVTKSGTGGGTVTSTPIGIDCGVDCTEDYNFNEVVTLTVTPDTGSIFAGWSGDPDCSDSSVTIDSDMTCNAIFDLTTSDSCDCSDPNAILGTQGNDTIDGTSGADIICGFGGDDVIRGLEGADCLDGGLGNDELRGGRNQDQVFGGVGDDDLRGGRGSDTLDGGTGIDSINGGNGTDLCLNGETLSNCEATTSYTLNINLNGSGYGTVESNPTGIDCGTDCGQEYNEDTVVTLTPTSLFGSLFVAWTGDQDCVDGIITLDSDKNCTATFDLILNNGCDCNDPNAIIGTEGNDTIDGTAGADIICGLGGDDVLRGLEGADCIDGGSGNDEIRGGRNQDQVFGGIGDDDLRGGRGADSIDGGDGIDIIDGGNGNDTCINGETLNNCENTEPVQRFLLNINKVGTGTGIVTSLPVGIDCGTDCDENYDLNTEVSLTATPDAGSLFAGWSGDSDCLDGVVTLDADKTCTAEFNTEAVVQYSLDVTKIGQGGGVITSDIEGIDCGLNCNQDYDEDTAVTLTAISDNGSIFTGWFGDCSGENTTTVVTLNRSKTCSAIFDIDSGTQDQHILNITKLGEGNGLVFSIPSGIDCGTDCDESYIQNRTVVLHAIPAPGSKFVEWGGNSDCSDGVVTMGSEKACIAIFDRGLKECNCNSLSAIIGTSGDDILNGTSGDDVICGFDGNDIINGFGGNDCIEGGLGDDQIDGGDGLDNILGGDGNDNIQGGLGDDNLDGEDGIDNLDGGLDIDVCLNGETRTNCENNLLPPEINLISPIDDSTFGDTSPILLFKYSDPDSKVNIDAFNLLINGVSANLSCLVEKTSATCPILGLNFGQHSIDVSISDIEGNTTVESYNFTIDPDYPVVRPVFNHISSNVDDWYGEEEVSELGGIEVSWQCSESEGNIIVIDPDSGTNGQGALFSINPLTGDRSMTSDFGVGSNQGIDPVDFLLINQGDVIVVDSNSGTGAGGALITVDSATGSKTDFVDIGNIQFGSELSENPIALELNKEKAPTQIPISGKTYFVIDPDSGTSSRGALFLVTQNENLFDQFIVNNGLISDFGTGNNRGVDPRDLVSDQNNNLYIIDSNAGTSSLGALFYLDTDTFERTIVSDFGVGNNPGVDPSALELDLVSNLAYVIDSNAGTNSQGALFSVDLLTGQRVLISDFGFGDNQGVNPSGLAIDRSGDIYVVDPEAGTDNKGTLFLVDVETGNRVVVSDFGFGNNKGVNPTKVRLGTSSVADINCTVSTSPSTFSDEGVNEVFGTVTNSLGNSSTIGTFVKIDRTPPMSEITSIDFHTIPSDQFELIPIPNTDPQEFIQFFVYSGVTQDNLSGSSRVECFHEEFLFGRILFPYSQLSRIFTGEGGTPIIEGLETTNGDNFVCKKDDLIGSSFGDNRVFAEMFDKAGNSATSIGYDVELLDGTDTNPPNVGNIDSDLDSCYDSQNDIYRLKFSAGANVSDSGSGSDSSGNDFFGSGGNLPGDSECSSIGSPGYNACSGVRGIDGNAYRNLFNLRTLTSTDITFIYSTRDNAGNITEIPVNYVLPNPNEVIQCQLPGAG